MRTAPSPLRAWIALTTAIWSFVLLPVLPAYAVASGQTTSASASSGSEAERMFASQAQSFGSAMSQGLTDKQLAELAERQALGMASAAATSEIQQWLSGFGTARARIDVDRHMSLKNSQLDILLPWYDKGNSVWFTQHGIRHTDNRTQTNQGVGYRHFGDGSMSGINLFYDYDLSRYHSRLSVGTEYWRDYLKLGSNFYFGQGRWRAAPEFDHQKEAKAADGWDLRAEGWLPAYPQLGGNLTIAQYFGQEVALFNKDNRQRNPVSATVGAGWTPFPLLTMNAEHSFANRGNNDTRVGLQLNWAIGASLSQQLDSDRVNSKRTLLGSRHDLVERNNNIILKYRGRVEQANQLVMTLSATHGALANGSETNTVTAVVTNTLGMPLAGQVVTFTLSEHVAPVGGLVAGIASPLAVGSANTNLNTNTVARTTALHQVMTDINGEATFDVTSLVADEHDVHAIAGTMVAPVSTTTIFVPDSGPVIPGSGIDLVVEDNFAPANGTDMNSVRVTITDGSGNPLVGETVSFSTDNGALFVASGTTTASDTTDANGEILVALTHTTPGITNVTATTSTTGSSQSVAVMFTADSSNAYIWDMYVVDNNAFADGIDTNRVKVVITDSMGTPLPYQQVSFSVDNGAVFTSTGTASATGVTDINGELLITLTNTTIGSTFVTAFINGNSATVPVQFVMVSVLSLVVVNDNAVANGSDTNSVRFTLTDSNNNPLVGEWVYFYDDTGTVYFDTYSGVTDSNGEILITLTSYIAGTSNITANFNGKTQSVPVTFVADSSTAQLWNIEVVDNYAVANGIATNSVRATIADANGNRVANQVVDFDVNNGALFTTTGSTTASGTTNANGEVTLTLTNTTAGGSQVNVTFNGNTYGVWVEFVDNDAAAIIASFVVIDDYALADGSHTNSVQVTITDNLSNPLPNQSVSFTASNGAVFTSGANGMTDSNGEITLWLTNLTAGITNVTASINGNNQTVQVNFMPYTATAQIASLVVVDNYALANGIATNRVKAKVTDDNNTPLVGHMVSFSADNGATIAAMGITDSNGEVILTLTNTTAGIANVTATIAHNGNSQSVATTFTANNSLAQVASLVVVDNYAIANGTATNSVRATVTDGTNPVAFQQVSFSADNGATIAAIGFTNASGQVMMTLTSTTEGISNVTASTSVNSQTVATTFIVNNPAAQITSLITVDNNALANGVSTNSVKATVVDNNNLPLANQSVYFTVSNGGVMTSAQGITDSLGEVTMTLTNTNTGTARVTATINSSQRTTDTSFWAPRVVLSIITNNARSDGQQQNQFMATVTDRFGQPMTNLPITATPVANYSWWNEASEVTWGYTQTDTGPTDSSGRTTFTAMSTTIQPSLRYNVCMMVYGEEICVSPSNNINFTVPTFLGVCETTATYGTQGIGVVEVRYTHRAYDSVTGQPVKGLRLRNGWGSDTDYDYSNYTSLSRIEGYASDYTRIWSVGMSRITDASGMIASVPYGQPSPTGEWEVSFLYNAPSSFTIPAAVTSTWVSGAGNGTAAAYIIQPSLAEQTATSSVYMMNGFQYLSGISTHYSCNGEEHRIPGVSTLGRAPIALPGGPVYP